MFRPKHPVREPQRTVDAGHAAHDARSAGCGRAWALGLGPDEQLVASALDVEI
jgi:hypothetical protein